MARGGSHHTGVTIFGRLETMSRLTQASLKTWRTGQQTKQLGRCALCGLPLGTSPPHDPVGDHDHRTGAMRGVLHRGCNSLLGCVENNAPRYGVRDIGVFANGVAQYLRAHIVNTTGLLHPSFRTPDEKRLRRNAKARKTRAANRGLTDAE
jgi:Autographiviridae endonuclease VII